MREMRHKQARRNDEVKFIPVVTDCNQNQHCDGA